MKKILLFLIVFIYGMCAFCTENDCMNFDDNILLKSFYGASVFKEGNVYSVNLYDNTNIAILDWEKFNIPKNAVIKFYFSNDNQVIINKIFGETSQIYGKIENNPNSKSGTIIFSNPAGFVFNPSSSVQNEGALLFTTHKINAETFDLIAQKALDRKFHGITILSGAKIFSKDNLSLVSLGISITGAVLKNKDNIFITAQTLNYSPDTEIITADKIKNIKKFTLNDSVYFNNGENNLSFPENKNAFSIKNSIITSSDGQIVIKSYNKNSDVNISECFFDKDIIIKSVNDVNIFSASQKNNNQIADKSKGAVDGNIEINADNNVILSSLSQNSTFPLYKDVFIQAAGGILFKNVRIMEDVSQNVTLKASDINIENYDITSQDWSNSILGNITANANNIMAVQTQIMGNSILNALDGNIELYGVLLGHNGEKKANLNAENIIIKDSVNSLNKSFIARVRSNINAKAQNVIVFANNSLDKSESPYATLEARIINAENFSFKGIKIENPQNLHFNLVDVMSDLVFNGMINESMEKLTNVTLKRVKVDGNLIFNNLNQLNLEGNKIYGNLYLNNIKNWIMGATSVEEDVVVQKVEEYFATDEDNTYKGGIKYFYEKASEE